jgi:hypothetical protein
MLKKLFSSITKFRKSLQMAELEMYILSRHPTSAGDVERLTREYHHKTNGNYFNRMV